jgi:GNAT superfamily N-acetyltransferase
LVIAANFTQEATSFHVVCCGDLPHFRTRHAAAASLAAPDMSVYKTFPGASDETPLLFYLQVDSKVCSYFRTIPDEVTVDGQTHPWVWTGDNHTYPEFRRRGLSTQLQTRATQYLHERGIGRGSVFSTDVTLHTFEGIGFTIVGYAKRFLLVRSAAPLLRAHFRRGPRRGLLQALAKPVFGAAVTGLGMWNRALSPFATRADESSGAHEELPSHLARISATRRVHFSVDAAMWRSKIDIAARNGDMLLWAVRDARSDAVIAHAVLRTRFQDEPLAEKYRDFQLMTLMDFSLADGDAKAAAGIVRHAVQYFLQSGCDVLEIISNNNLVNRAAFRRGLVPVGRGMSFAFSAPPQWKLPPEIAQLDMWPLTRFCGDAFSF